MKGGSAAVAVYVAIFCPISVYVLGLAKESLPRKTISYSELQQLTSMRSFLKDSDKTFSSFLVDEPHNRFYVGANNTIYVLNLTSVDQDLFTIDWKVTEKEHHSCLRKGKKAKCNNYIRILEVWNETHLFACGTYAFDPHYAFINVFDSFDAPESRITGMENGRGRCPFEPTHPFAATLADQVLYAATAVDFQGKDIAVVKSKGQFEKIRTEESVNWLSDPQFVGSTFVRENEGSGDDDKLYFFFSEVAREFDYYKIPRVPRVARVCKSDIGGLKTLQKKWTSFLKARLVCSDEKNEMYFNTIHDVFTLQRVPGDAESTVFYGVFSTKWYNQVISAVCAYSIKEVNDAFLGSYMGYKSDARKWVIFEGEVPDPRPGMCITDKLKEKGYNTTLDLPDNVLMFIRDHLLMAGFINPIGKKPLLIMKDTRYSKIIVQREKSRSGSDYEVFYLGTETGHLHKVINTGSKVLVVEDYVIFEPEEKVLSITLRQGFLYIGSSNRLVQLPAVNCSRYSHCNACLLARDPSCTWDAQKWECVHIESTNIQRSQNVEDVYQQAKTLCQNGKESPVPLTKVVSVVEGTTVFLQCTPSSAWSTCEWTTSNGTLENNDNIGGIHIMVSQSTLGEYKCSCVEEHIHIPEAHYSLETKPSDSPSKVKDSVNYFLMFVFLVLGIFIGVLVYKYGHSWCIKMLASKGGCNRDCTNAPQGATVHSLDSTDEVRPLTITQRSGSGGNGTSEKEVVYENVEKEVNGMNLGSPRNQTISIISCQDETSI
ncbi:semaphorin-4F-like [Mobula birostris]|uniref:semaphorin-4F-like n=1 Tax=Mobula birostris TaxID=1983395 RepID=UPI003B2805FE